MSKIKTPAPPWEGGTGRSKKATYSNGKFTFTAHSPQENCGRPWRFPPTPITDAIFDFLGGGERGDIVAISWCPVAVHDRPALHIEEHDGRVRLTCLEGCEGNEIADVLATAGIDVGESSGEYTPVAFLTPRQWVFNRERSPRRRVAIERFSNWFRPISDASDWIGKSATGRRFLRAIEFTLEPPPIIQFAPSLRHRPSGRDLPAVIVPLQRRSGAETAAHVLFLEPDGNCIAHVERPYVLAGVLEGAAAWLFPQHAADDIVNVTLDLWTGLAVFQATGCVTAVVSEINCVALPPEVDRVTIFNNFDVSLIDAEQLERRLINEGRRVKLIQEDLGGSLQCFTDTECGWQPGSGASFELFHPDEVLWAMKNARELHNVGT